MAQGEPKRQQLLVMQTSTSLLATTLPVQTAPKDFRNDHTALI